MKNIAKKFLDSHPDLEKILLVMTLAGLTDLEIICRL
jgi:hypothetical protein